MVELEFEPFDISWCKYLEYILFLAKMNKLLKSKFVLVASVLGLPLVHMVKPKSYQREGQPRKTEN